MTAPRTWIDVIDARTREVYDVDTRLERLEEIREAAEARCAALAPAPRHDGDATRERAGWALLARQITRMLAIRGGY